MKSPAKQPSKANKAPISAHPAFPAIVALWFAALFGIGCMVLPARLLESAISPLGLSLGLGGRALFAALIAIVGGLTGFILGRRIADSHANAPKAGTGRNFSPAPRAPFNAKEAMEAVENEEPGQRGNRRRSLAIEEDARASDFLIVAPVPGGGKEPPKIGELQAASAGAGLAGETSTPAAQPVEEPSNADEQAMPEIAEMEPIATFQEPETVQELENPAEQEQQEVAFDHEHAPAELELTEESEVDIPKDPPFEQPLVFNAPSLARQREVEEATEEVAEFAHEDAEKRHTGQRVELELVSESSPDGEYEGDWAAAPLDQLGLVQLVQRLGHSLERHRRLLAARPAIAESSALQREPGFDTGLEAAPAEEATQAMAAFFNRQQLAFEEPEGEAEDDLATSFGLPLGRDDTSFAHEEPQVLPEAEEYGEPAAFACEDETEEQDDVDDTEGFGSLVQMHNPFRFQESEFVRVEEPEDEDEDGFIPAVIFPSQQAQPAPREMPADETPAASPEPDASARPFDPPAGAARIAPAQTDDALREALAKLQRAGGAG